MRLLRGKVPVVLDRYSYRFELGKAQVIRDGADVLFVCTGLSTMWALQAAEQLAADRIDAGVVHAPTIKPLDEATLLNCMSRPGRLVVICENHSVVGGFGEAVLALAAREGVTGRLRHVGLPDAFLDAGALPTLHDRYGISPQRLVERVKAWL
jgi:transketolase